MLTTVPEDAGGMKAIMSRGITACNLKRKYALGLVQWRPGSPGTLRNNNAQMEFGACSWPESVPEDPWPMLIMELCHVARLERY